ncbi:MAG: pantoate--beta-alanine ligase [Coriobacteriales bacterium]|jgi:pantoate--beta-alanine ligase
MAQSQIVLLETKQQVREFTAKVRSEGKTIGLVPTMGAIHEGHQSLVRRALRDADVAIASVFVNPTQFSPTEDFDAYPRTLEADMKKLEEAGASAVFAPSVSAMYGEEMAEHIKREGLVDFGFMSHAVPGSAAKLWEGHDRPHHFAGVTTVVSKLFNIVRPDVACFGEKDYQQLAVIRQMVSDMDFNIKIIGCPIVREESGLAVSSRNRYMDDSQRERALSLSRSLKDARDDFASGVRDVSKILDRAKATIEGAGLKIDYVAIVDATTLNPLDDLTGIDGRDARMIIAAKVDDVRLIDNASIG